MTNHRCGICLPPVSPEPSPPPGRHRNSREAVSITANTPHHEHTFTQTHLRSLKSLPHMHLTATRPLRNYNPANLPAAFTTPSPSYHHMPHRPAPRELWKTSCGLSRAAQPARHSARGTAAITDVELVGAFSIRPYGLKRRHSYCSSSSAAGTTTAPILPPYPHFAVECGIATKPLTIASHSPRHHPGGCLS